MERLVYIVSAFNKKVNEHCRLLGPPYFSPPSTIYCTYYIMNVYKKSKSLVNTRKEEEEKGEKKSPRFFFSSFRVL